MNTIDELLYYCQQSEPVGALLLTGEWGCGKTYLIDNEFKTALGDNAVLLRVSLFGISSAEEIHSSVKNAWINEYCRQKGIEGLNAKFSEWKKLISKLNFIPEKIRNIASTDATILFSIGNTLNSKKVILVFDDLERCRMCSVDVLGIINDYCENQKYHTIIVANQEKITGYQKEAPISAEINFTSAKNKDINNDSSATLTIYPALKKEQGELSYSEIKEKIIQRTIEYIPNYSKIVPAVIDEMKYEDPEYKAFVRTCEDELLDLFAPDRTSNSIIEDELLDLFAPDRTSNSIIADKPSKKTGKESEKDHKRPHNIRSLKCAIQDFYRVYKILNDNGFTDISKWFYSFVSYVISYKANIITADKCDSIYFDAEVNKLYPAFQSQYMFKSIKQWILSGKWNSDALNHEIEVIKKRNEALKPWEVIRINRIMDIEEDVLQSGFTEFLDNAYAGNIGLNDYVLLIENSAWARKYNYEFPKQIEWNLVNVGIKKCIEKVKEALPEGQLLFHYISEDSKESFTSEEWETYTIIKDFALTDSLIFFRNRMLYIEKVQSLLSASFLYLQNKRFNTFDEEMAHVTADAFEKDTNSGKNLFIKSFINMWKFQIDSQDMNVSDCLKGLLKLKELLVDKLGTSKSMSKTFSVIHTEHFVQEIDDLISSHSSKS